MFIPQAQPHAQSLFLFPIVFGINIIIYIRLPDLCFSICRFSQVVFIPQAQPHAQSLFLFPIVFGINLIHFFDFFGEKEEWCSRKFDRLFCCFDPLSITPFDSEKNQSECEPFRKAQRFWQRKVWTQRHSREEKLRCKFFGKEKRKTRRQYWGAQFWQGEVQNSSPILARQWWRHFRLSLSLSLCISLSLSPNVPHAQYRKRFRASYNIHNGAWRQDYR